MILMNPIFYFSTLYGQLCITLISWGKYIQQLDSIEETISASRHFVKLLGKVSTTISSALFWQVANLQVGLILWVFVSLIFILFHNEGEKNIMLCFCKNILICMYDKLKSKYDLLIWECTNKTLSRNLHLKLRQYRNLF